MNDFYNPFTSQLKEVEENMEKIICDKCGAEWNLNWGDSEDFWHVVIIRNVKTFAP